MCNQGICVFSEIFSEYAYSLTFPEIFRGYEYSLCFIKQLLNIFTEPKSVNMCNGSSLSIIEKILGNTYIP